MKTSGDKTRKRKKNMEVKNNEGGRDKSGDETCEMK